MAEIPGIPDQSENHFSLIIFGNTELKPDEFKIVIQKQSAIFFWFYFICASISFYPGSIFKGRRVLHA